MSQITAAMSVFKRYEKKYMVTQEQYIQLMPRLLEYMELDQYGKHTICNIYLDTADYDLIRKSIEKPVYKEKIRLRSYGVPHADSTVFLELKKKCKGIVYKRRVPMTLHEAEQYLYEDVYPKERDCQILKEIDYCLKKYDVMAGAYVSYNRIAMFCTHDPDLRITFDQNIICRNYDMRLELGSFGAKLLDDEIYLMEIKIPGVMEKWLAEILSELKIYPVSFSKYGTYYQKYIIPEWISKKIVDISSSSLNTVNSKIINQGGFKYA